MVDILLVTLPEALRHPDTAQHSDRLEQLVRLQSILPESSALEPMISLALSNQLPPIFPSVLRPSLSSGSSITTGLASRRYQSRHHPKGARTKIDISQFLSTSSGTDHTRQIVVNLLYLEPAVRQQVLSWVQKNYKTCSVEYLSGILLALVDSASSQEELVTENKTYLLTACTRLLKTMKGQYYPHSVLETSAACICQIVRDVVAARPDLLAMVLEECRLLKQGAINIGIIDITSTLLSYCGGNANALVQVVLDHAWSWAVGVFSQDSVGVNTHRMLTALGDTHSLY